MFSRQNIFESSSYEYDNFFPQNNYIDNDFDSHSREINHFNNFNLDSKTFMENSPNTNNENNEDHEENGLFSFKPNEKQEKQEDNDNFNASNLQIPHISNIPQKYVNENISTNLANAKTKVTSILSKKTKRPNDETTENGKTYEKKTNCGRKSKESNEKGSHDKFSDDNIMRKIKSNLLNYGHKRLNNSFENKKLYFLKLSSEINENLKKDYNEKLMKTILKELYETSPISTKYRKQKIDNFDHNKQLIEKIYKEQEEIEVINRLNITYLDLLDEFKIFYLENFLNEIREEEKDKMPEEKIEIYIEKIKKLCLNYESWFLNKNGRNRKKNSQ
jgi:hypothetical protein